MKELREIAEWLTLGKVLFGVVVGVVAYLARHFFTCRGAEASARRAEAAADRIVASQLENIRILGENVGHLKGMAERVEDLATRLGAVEGKVDHINTAGCARGQGGCLG